ncbi:MAG: 4-hydroxy-tetrahydrodipicolinate reductase [Elusimicrobia bacterium HGW-Elusimicrobia-3]|nr:MAG: 4-hydroxy-tetrahydrodipicolinate reductase [Elusimicrobia bacterium HGW-Elusimicrobia-3]
MKSRPLKVLVCGASGRMGRAVLSEIEASPAFARAGGVDARPGPGAEPPDAFTRLLALADAVVDFSSPAPSIAYAQACAAARKPFVTGVTGYAPKQQAALKAAARRTAVFHSPNMSPAVNLTFALAALAARRLKDFDIHVHEAHHSAKKDAPSGTALRYAERIAAARGGALPPITSARAGDIVGDHTVLYAGPHERVEIAHRAHSRAVFAAGALKAAAWLAGKKPGFYDYSDLLDLKSF